jgi:hypothetical protein
MGRGANLKIKGGKHSKLISLDLCINVLHRHADIVATPKVGCEAAVSKAVHVGATEGGHAHPAK